MPLPHRLAALTAAGVLAAAGLTGCSGAGEAGGTGSSSRAGAEGALGKAAFDNAGEPVVKGTFDSPMAKGAKVDIAIMGLRVKGKLATLTVQFTPHVPGGAPNSLNAYKLNGELGLGTSLIDPVNLKRYVVVKDSSGKELETDDILTRMANDQVTPFTFTFAAPPENVKTIDVQIGSWPTFRDVPVER